jgi:predicted alpha/beta hydrolase family esterase
MTICIVIHGCPGNKEKALDAEKRTYDKHWIPWLKKKLEDKGVKTETPLMPEPWEPKYVEWKDEIEKLDINESSVLIGHSCSGGFLVRWLGETKKKVRKLILVAPAIMFNRNYLPLRDLLEFEINGSIQENIGEIVIFVSDDDSEGIKKSVELFSDALNVRPVMFKGKGHFSEGDMGTKEFPELLEEVLK